MREIVQDLEERQQRIAKLTSENRRLKSQLEQALSESADANASPDRRQEEPDRPEADAYAAAHALIAEAVRSARDLLTAGDQHHVLPQADEAARAAVERATARARALRAAHPTGQDLHRVTTFARILRSQFDAVLDAFEVESRRLTSLVDPPSPTSRGTAEPSSRPPRPRSSWPPPHRRRSRSLR